MKITDLRSKVIAELDSRNLAQPSIRKNALERVLEFIKQSEYHNNGELHLPYDKKRLKEEYASYKGKELYGAENSIINEIYNQYE